MMNNSASGLFLFFCLCIAVPYAEATSLAISVQREVADPRVVHALRKRQSGTVPVELGKSLYWFGHFNVGDSGSQKLLIDTGSTDLILNKGLYKPSKHEKPYGTGKFYIDYEGVNRAGFGFETINGTVSTDIVSSGDLSVPDAAVGNTTSWKYIDVPQLPWGNPGNGIIGFSNAQSSSFHPPSESWFRKLCQNNAISSCRLGFALETSGNGTLHIGDVAKDAVEGDFVVVPQSKDGIYTAIGDVTLDGKVLLENQTFTFDCGTDNLQGSLEAGRVIFKQLGYTTYTKTSSTNLFNPGKPEKVLNAFFPCNKPPKIGLSFPPQHTLKSGENATIFEISTRTLIWDVYDHGDNNCTSVFGGTNALDDGDWLIGQPFFAGHYVDFDIPAKTIGFANLKNP